MLKISFLVMKTQLHRICFKYNISLHFRTLPYISECDHIYVYVVGLYILADC